MKKIEIGDIRSSASSLSLLNTGYLLYKNEKYLNYEYHVYVDHMAIIEGACEFPDGTKTKLSLRELPISSCSCGKPQLCEHAVCLYFLLKDTVTQLLQDNNGLNLKRDKKVEELENLNTIMKKIIYENSSFNQKFTLTPELTIYNNKVEKLELRFASNSEEEIIKDVPNFLSQISTSNMNRSYIMDFKYNIKDFDPLSRDLIEILNLQGDTSKNSDKILTFVFDRYKYKELYVSDHTKSSITTFSNDPAPLKFQYNHFTFKSDDHYINVISTLNRKYILYKNVIYYGDYNQKLANVYLLLKENDFQIVFNKENEFLFYLNIYNELKSNIKVGLDEKEIVHKLKIDTYLTYDKFLYLDFKRFLDGKNISFTKEYDNILEYKNYTNLLKLLEFDSIGKKFIIKDRNKILKVISDNLGDLRSFGNLFVSKNIEKLNIKRINQVHIKGSSKINFASIFFGDYEFTPSELKHILDEYNNNNHYFELDENNLIHITEETINIIKDITEISNEDGLIPYYKAYALKEYSTVDEGTLLEFSTKLGNYNNLPVTISSELEAFYRPYQLQGVKWLKLINEYGMGGILADDMGLGKTIEVIGLLDGLKHERPSIIISPTSLIFNWENEFKKFAPWLNPQVVYGTKADREQIIKNAKKDSIFITSYQTLRSDLELYLDFNFETIIIDEAQYIKNPTAKKTKAVKELQANSRFALTGTPIENSLLDLWSLFDFILPGYLPNKKTFLGRYQDEPMDDLKAKIAPFLLRRIKTDVLKLEPKIENFSYAVMSDDQRKVYEGYLLEGRNAISDNNGTNKRSIMLSYLVRMRQLSCDPRLFIEDYEGSIAKLDLLEEIVLEKVSDGHKILIFSQFTSNFVFISEMLKKHEISFLELNGKTKVLDRKKLVDQFNEDESIKVFLISLKAGGNGLNLTSADTVIHYDPWWNIAAMSQATDRAYRIGQERSVHVIKMITKNTIEEKIVELQREKQNLSDDLINENDVLSSLSTSDIMKLFN